MGDLVNLRRERKRRAKAAEASVAADRRARFGRTKAERTLSDAEGAMADRRLDGHRLVDPSGPAETPDDA